MRIAGKPVSVALLAACGLTLQVWQAANAADPASTVSRSTAAAAELKAEMANREANKKVVLAFYAAIVKLSFEEARNYIGDYYIEHDPEREDGLSGLKKALDYDGRRGNRQTIVHELVVADGDLVAVYSRSTPIMVRPAGLPPGGLAPGATGSGPPGGEPQPNLVGDIFRLQNGKIVEHWNAIYKP